MNDYRAIIERKRKEKGFNQTQLAKEIGISQAYMNQIEKGTRNPTLPVLMRICVILEISMFGESKQDE